MVFLLFSIELILMLAGFAGLFVYETKVQLLLFIMLIVIGTGLFVYTLYAYQKKRGKTSRLDCWDCAIYSPDCLPSPGMGKSLDCDSFDCTPDCSP
ncbi:hypothetical protein LCM10_05895 [Rossellomorea aquimaris]|uniref:hypothetical protein n=1 Tax=Rossellomorea aquimaris TaxID=189382 RepID=UPI001CD31190|nr:hypothetical protein [Rossellomorea aquimaris]MCA1054512.1 hypothetical protein [Rossellomorea aquimaris]